jgi:hypothetical protein
MIGGSIAGLAAVILGLAGWLAHDYLYDASFMQVPAGSSGYEIDTCRTGGALYFGYFFTPTRAVHLTGVQLVGVPDGFTVEGIYAVNRLKSKKIAVGAATQQDWDRMGYSGVHLYSVSDVSLPAGGMGEWWLVAKIVPSEPGKQTIEGIRVSYNSGWRSGSTVYDEQVTTDCTT